jgi:hypothetical protein
MEYGRLVVAVPASTPPPVFDTVKVLSLNEFTDAPPKSRELGVTLIVGFATFTVTLSLPGNVRV